MGLWKGEYTFISLIRELLQIIITVPDVVPLPEQFNSIHESPMCFGKTCGNDREVEINPTKMYMFQVSGMLGHLLQNKKLSCFTLILCN